MKASISYPGFQRLRAAPSGSFWRQPMRPPSSPSWPSTSTRRTTDACVRILRARRPQSRGASRNGRRHAVDGPRIRVAVARPGASERTLPYGSDEEVYSLTSASVDAVRFVTGMGRPRAEATESRLQLVITALDGLEEDTDADVERREHRLIEEQSRIRRELEAVGRGEVKVLDKDTALERTREILTLFSGLWATFIACATASRRSTLTFAAASWSARARGATSSRTSSQGSISSGSALQAEPSSRSGACSTIPSSPPASRRRSTPCSRATLRAILAVEERRMLRTMRRNLLERGGDVHDTTKRLAQGLRNFVESRRYLEEHRLNRLLTEAMRAGIDAADEQSPVRRTGIELSRTGFTPRSAGQMVLWDPVTYAPPPPVEDGTPPPLDLSAVGERIARSEINIRELRENVADVLSPQGPGECRRGTRGVSRSRASAASSVSWSSRFVTAFPARAPRASSGRGSTAASAPPP